MQRHAGACLPFSGLTQTVHLNVQVLMDVYSKLGACEGFLKDAASEVYCTTIRGRWCFLPGIMWLTLGRWRLPQDVCALP